MPDIKQQLVKHEALRLKVYTDSLGIETIGVGRNLRDQGISKDEAYLLLVNDIQRVTYDCQNFRWFDDLDIIRRKVIIDMVFNMGFNRFSTFKKTINHLALGHYLEASKEMLRSKWTSQVGIRAYRLSSMMATGRDYK